MDAFTIIGKNYLSQARVLHASLLKHHPDSRLFVVLYDHVGDDWAPDGEPFTEIVLASDLAIPNWDEFTFKYNLTEACTAIKPFCFRYLFERHSLQHLVYFDPDILVMSPLSELIDQMSTSTTVLTPHITAPLPNDGKHPNHDAHLLTGAFNLGFLAVRNNPTGLNLIDWWSERLYEHCKSRINSGYFVDQKWMDLAPSLFPDTAILRHDGYNVAYWNLPTRVLKKSSDGYTVNGQSLRFFHFSGFDPSRPEIVSKYTDRTYDDFKGDVRQIFDEYAHLMLEESYQTSKKSVNAYSVYDSGELVTEPDRDVYYDLGPEQRSRYGNPFSTIAPGNYHTYVRSGDNGMSKHYGNVNLLNNEVDHYRRLLQTRPHRMATALSRFVNSVVRR